VCQGLLLHGVNAESRGFAVAGELNVIPDALSNEAKAPLLVEELAGARAKRAK
jgi:hypothetical protein